MTTLAVLLAAAGSFLLARWLFNRQVSRGRAFALIFDGATWRGGVCKRIDEGIEFAGLRYQAGVLWPVPLAPGLTLYIHAAERIPLATHEQLERARRSAKPTMLFKGGGDMLFLMQIMSAVVPIVVCIWFMLSVGSLEGRINALSVQVEKANSVLSKPLVVDFSAPDLPGGE